MSLQAIVIPAKQQPVKGIVVILHGWGASAEDVKSLATFIDLPNYQLVFPDAPFPHPYAAAGRMWYNFPNYFNFQSTPDFYDRPDLSTSRQQLVDFLKSLTEQTDIPLSRVILAGFSQGGAMTLDVGLNLPLAGLLVLSGYLHAPIQPHTSNVPPLAIVHGRQDTVVPLTAAQQARASLEAIGATVYYQEFDMGHEIQPSVLTLMQRFVKEWLP